MILIICHTHFYQFWSSSCSCYCDWSYRIVSRVCHIIWGCRVLPHLLMMLCPAVSRLDKQVWSATVEGTVSAAERIIIVYHMWNWEKAHSNKANSLKKEEIFGCIMNAFQLYLRQNSWIGWIITFQLLLSLTMWSHD